MRPSPSSLAALGLLLAAGAGSEEIDLEGALQRGATRPAARAAQERARAADAAATAEKRQALLPTLAARAAHVERDRALELLTPIGGFEFGARASNRVDLELAWPLLDAPRLLHEAPARRLEADAADGAARRTAAELAAEAAGLFFDVLAIDARLEANAPLIRSLEERLSEVATRVELGRALDADRLRVSLALADARQQQLALGERRLVARLALARAVGSDAEVEPRFDPAQLPGALPAEPDALALALERRSDLAALAARRGAAAERVGGVAAELVPRVEARGAWRFDDGSGLQPDRYFEVSLSATWVPFAAGTRPARAALQRALEAELEHQLAELRRGIAVEVRQSLAEFRIAAGELELARAGVGEAEETLRVSGARYAEGRETVNDLLQAEAVLRDRRARLRLAELARGRAWVALRLATGELSS